MKIKLFFEKGVCLFGIATLFISCGKGNIGSSEETTSTDSLVTTAFSQEISSETTTIPSSSMQSDTISSQPTLSSEAAPMSPEVEALIKISEKETWEYTDEDCTLLLTSNFEEICQAYGIDITEEPQGGTFLEGNPVPSGIIYLNKKLIIPYDMDKTEVPYFLGMYGEDKTTNQYFDFGMEFHSYNYQSSDYKVEDTFIYRGQSVKNPVKIVQYKENGLDFSFCFEQEENNGPFILYVEYISLSSS